MTRDRWLTFFLGAALGITVGLVLLFLNFSSEDPPPPPTTAVTETVKEYVEVVPPVCTDAIDASQDIIKLSTRALKISARIVAAATNDNDTKLQAQTAAAIQNARDMSVPLINYKRTSIQCLKEAK